MIRRFKKQNQEHRFYRTNDRIFATSLRVLDSEGKQIGVLSRFEALSKAREEGLDLVEIAPNAKPVVAKIIDFKKFLYQEAKKKREEKKKAKVSETKEVRLGPFMDTHDLEVMLRRARSFLVDGDKVRLVVKFVGRQIIHPEFGHQVTKKAVAGLDDVSKVEKVARLEGKNLITILSPEKKTRTKTEQSESEIKENYETKNKKVGEKTI